jgi:Uma2 family endonuclease
MIVEYAPYRVTVDQFGTMAEAGVFAGDERVELIEGVLVSYAPPHGDLHATAVWGLAEAVRATLGNRAMYWSQLPVVLSEATELEPDLALLRVRDGGYRTKPRAADVHAIVEVADSSLRADRTIKSKLYAAACVPEYWVVDVRSRRIEIHRDPAGDRYDRLFVAECCDAVSFAAFPDAVLSVSELVG